MSHCTLPQAFSTGSHLSGIWVVALLLVAIGCRTNTAGLPGSPSGAHQVESTPEGTAVFGPVAGGARSPMQHVSPLPVVRVSFDGRSFVRETDSGVRTFKVWGVNYDHDSVGKGRLLEDYWETEWDEVVADFQEMRELGANVVRIHLQFGKFMDSTDAPNERALDQLKRLLRLAEEKGLYLDLTGLGCYHKSDVPPWYDVLAEQGRWCAQANFWKAIARTCKGSSAVFCFDLMNEPVIDGKSDAGWLGGELGGKYFVQRLTRDNAGRSQVEIARGWVEVLTRAIRTEDPSRLITVGVIPWAQVWPGAKPVFYSPEVSPLLDFVSVHVYPKSGEIDKAMHAIQVHQIGKPVVIEETFPLACSLVEMREFLNRTRPNVAGYMSFYWGRTAAECEAAPVGDVVSRLTGGWLREFQSHAERMKSP